MRCMRATILTSIAAIAVLLFAIGFQIPAVQEMATHMLRQSSLQLRSLQSGVLQYKNLLPSAILTSSPKLNSRSLHQTPTHQFTTTTPASTSQPPPTMSTTDSPFLNLVSTRRTFYQLSATSTIPDTRIKELVQHALKHVPSAFNSQTTRIVVVLNDQHRKLWDSIMEVYKLQLPAEKFAHAKGRMEGFKAGYGTLLFYEDTTVMREFQEKFKTYEDKFPGWSEQTNGMHQYVLWSALEDEGLGVNLQHYNPLIDTKIETDYEVPVTWSLKAQMVFGKPTGQPGEKQFQPVEERMKFFA